jgi:ABC-2 type transport system ATP-binding protein
MTKQEEIAIKVSHVSKDFKLPHEQQNSLKGRLINFRRKGYEIQHALNDISFEVKKGEFFGIVGRNGSGKSTLLKILAGIYTPNSGFVETNGKLTPFIELGVGFNPELSGRDNVFLNGALLGFSRKEMEGMYDDIVEFAEIERFMDQKLKNYSSGMQVRLAFSIAIRANTDILVLDEVLAVGDAAFQKKCFDYFMNLKKNNKTVILVTHDMSAVRQYCDRAVMLEKSKVIHEGKPERIAQEYQKLFIQDMENEKEREKAYSEGDRWGEGGIVAEEVKTSVTSEFINISVRYRTTQALDSPIYGFTVYGPDGTNILEGNTLKLKYKTGTVNSNEIVQMSWSVPNIFANGKYSISIGCCNKHMSQFYEWYNDASSFVINKDSITAGLVDPLVAINDYKVKDIATKTQLGTKEDIRK